MFRIISRYIYTDTFEKIDSASSYEEALLLLNEIKKETNYENKRIKQTTHT